MHDFVNKRPDGDVGEALVSFLQWISKYDRLFQDPCTIANKLVAVDAGTGEPLPPTLRTPAGDAVFPESLTGIPQRKSQQPSPLGGMAVTGPTKVKTEGNGSVSGVTAAVVPATAQA